MYNRGRSTIVTRKKERGANEEIKISHEKERERERDKKKEEKKKGALCSSSAFGCVRRRQLIRCCVTSVHFQLLNCSSSSLILSCLSVCL